jgi:hypothetical protein
MASTIIADLIWAGKVGCHIGAVENVIGRGAFMAGYAVWRNFSFVPLGLVFISPYLRGLAPWAEFFRCFAAGEGACEAKWAGSGLENAWRLSWLLRRVQGALRRAQGRLFDCAGRASLTPLRSG